MRGSLGPRLPSTEKPLQPTYLDQNKIFGLRLRLVPQLRYDRLHVIVQMITLEAIIGRVIGETLEQK